MINAMNVAWWVKRWSQLHPEKPAVFYGSAGLSYAQLHLQAEAAACWLQAEGIEKGDRVAVLLDNCPQFLELYLACARLGAIFVPLNFRLAAPEIDYLLGHSRPRLFVFSGALSERVRPLNFTVYQPPLVAAVVGEYLGPQQVRDYYDCTQSHQGKPLFLTASLGPADPTEPQVIMYTSGTTGHPKGAVLSYRKTFFNCLNANVFFKLRMDDTMLVVLPLFHSGGLFIQATPTLHQGGTIVLHQRFDTARVIRDIRRHQVTKFLGVPTVYRSLLDSPPDQREDLSLLQVCAIGGEKVTVDLLRECRDAGLPLRQIMGQTETSILLWASEEESLARPGTVGRPVFYAEVELWDRNGQKVESDGIGEIVVRGPVMMKEYWRDPEQTRKAIRDGWLRTGDLASQDRDGFFYLKARARDMFISGGENVYPSEVERVLRGHEAVADAAVVGVPDAKWGETGHAFIIPRAGAAPSPGDLTRYCREHLAAYKVPKSFSLCEDFPRTPLGKVRKFLLRGDALPQKA